MNKYLEKNMPIDFEMLGKIYNFVENYSFINYLVNKYKTNKQKTSVSMTGK